MPHVITFSGKLIVSEDPAQDSWSWRWTPVFGSQQRPVSGGLVLHDHQHPTRRRVTEARAQPVSSVDTSILSSHNAVLLILR